MTLKRKIIYKTLISTIFSLLLSYSAYAQLTTSAISGQIRDDKGEVVAGATVIVRHIPSGSQYYAITNRNGFYTIHGMRPGGPYTVKMTMVGYRDAEYYDIDIPLGETYVRNVQFADAAQQLDEAVVKADAPLFTTQKTGASTNVSKRQVEDLPNSARTIEGLTKLSPYANGMAFAGSDGRSTNFTLDGANFNNNFGLDSSLPGGGAPVSLEAIEALQFVVAPFDVRQSNFVGGGINAITKSGTNRYQGSAYVFYNDQHFRGDRAAGEVIPSTPSFNLSYGATAGGPIIKDKLFFFANFEMSRDSGETTSFRASAQQQEVLDDIAARLRDDYGYDPGSTTSYPGGVNNMKILLKLDWNINDNHKLSFRFNKTDNKEWCPPIENSCDDNFRNRNHSRYEEGVQPFSGNSYFKQNNIMSFAGELNSRFTNVVANRLLVTYTNNDSMRGSNSKRFPHIDIMTGDLSKEKNYIPFTSAGYELFSFNTGGKNRVINASDNLSIYVGKHILTVGLSFEHQTAFNSYTRNGCGYYRFASPEDFLEGKLPVSFALGYGYNGNENAGAEMKFFELSEYLQDEWAIGNRLRLTYGLRMDILEYNDKSLITNNAIIANNYNGRHVDTGAWPKTQIQVSPRVGFNWDVMGNKDLVVRGGTGLFQGRLPLVFFTNMPLQSGMIQNNVQRGDYSGKISDGQLVLTEKQKENLTILNGGLETGGKVITDVKKMIEALGLPTTISAKDGYLSPTGDIIGVDHNFKMPQIWKSSLAIDYKVPTSFPFTVTVEGMYNKTIYGVCLMNWNIDESKLVNRFNGPDSRINYYANPDYTFCGNNAYVLTNTNKGWGYTANLTVNMEPVRNLKIMAAYTHTESKEVSGMPGSNASSAYANLATVDGPNFSGVDRSVYVTPDRIMANVSYFIPWKVFCGKGLHLDAFYSAYSPAGNSYTYSNDMNGDGIAYDLMYIPATRDELKFKTEADRDAFWTFISNDRYLSSHKGQYAERYACTAPFVHKVDLRIAEDFAFKAGNTTHNFQLSISIDNVGNLLNPSWGIQKLSCYQKELTKTISPLAYEGTDEAGVPIFSMNKVNGDYPTRNFTQYYKNIADTWRILFGIKYVFN